MGHQQGSTLMRTARHRPAGRLIAALAGALIGFSVASEGRAFGQPEPAQPVRSKKPVRRPVIDLEKAASEVRSGQVVPEAEVTREPTPPPPVAPPPMRPIAEAAPAPAPKKSLPPAAAAAAPKAADPGAADVADLPPSAAGEPVKVVVLSAYAGESDASPQAQWRPMVGADASWRTVEVGGRAEDRIEIRTGLTGSVRIEVDGVITVQVDRLSRVRVERRARSDTSELSVELVRGRVEVQPTKTDDLRQGVEPVRIRTPDAALLRRTGVAVTYDAFKGTREAALPVR